MRVLDFIGAFGQRYFLIGTVNALLKNYMNIATRYLSKHIKSYHLFLHCFRLRLDLRLQMTVTWINYPSLILIFSQIYNAEIRHNNRDNETIIDN